MFNLKKIKGFFLCLSLFYLQEVRCEDPTPKSLTNQDIYSAVCNVETQEEPAKPFSQCAVCPSYTLENRIGSKFKLISIYKGFLTKKDETEAALYMHGCNGTEDNQGSLVLLKYGYGGWSRTGYYPALFLKNPPVALLDPEGKYIFVGKRIVKQDDGVSEELVSFSFPNNIMKREILLNTYYSTKTKQCRRSFSSTMEDPAAFGKTGITVNIEASEQTSCSLEGRGKKLKKYTNPSLKPGRYLLNFSMNHGSLLPDKQTDKIMTLLERLTEINE